MARAHRRVAGQAAKQPRQQRLSPSPPYWTKLKEFVDYEPVSAIDAETRGVLASSGIVKGQPFNPTDAQKVALQNAVTTAPKMILAMRQLGRADDRNLYYEDRQYENAWCGATSENQQETYLDLDQRAAYYQYAFSSASAMVMRTLGAGSKYPFTIRDADGEFLNGTNTPTSCTCRPTRPRACSGP